MAGPEKSENVRVPFFCAEATGCRKMLERLERLERFERVFKPLELLNLETI